MKKLLLVLAALALATPASALTVDEVIDLATAGVDPAVIRTQIEVTGATYELTAADLKKLTRAKVPQALIRFMIRTRAPAPTKDTGKSRRQVEALEQELADRRTGGSYFFYGTYYPYYDYGYYYGSPYYYGSTIVGGDSLYLHRAASDLGLGAFSLTFGSGNTYSGTFSGTLPSSSGFSVTPGSGFGFSPGAAPYGTVLSTLRSQGFRRLGR